MGLGIEEGTVSALISRSLEGPGDTDADDDVIGTSYVAPDVSPSCIEREDPGTESSEKEPTYEVRAMIRHVAVRQEKNKSTREILAVIGISLLHIQQAAVRRHAVRRAK